jgi:hypothetical protein
MNWKGFGSRRSLPNFKVLSRYSPGGTEENLEFFGRIYYEVEFYCHVFTVSTGLNLAIKNA